MAGMETKARTGMWANLPPVAGQHGGGGVVSPAYTADDFDGQTIEADLGGRNKKIETISGVKA